MTQIGEETTRELVEVMFPNHKGAKLSTCAVNFFIQQVSKSDNSNVDVSTLQGFVEFLISKNYN